MKFETKSSGIQNRLKLKSGDSVRGVFAGDPYQFEQHWKDGKSTLCPGRLSCDKCASGDKPKFRFYINFITKENEAYVVKVFEQGWKVFLDLKALHEGGYDLEKYLMKITRNGSTMNDTSYSIVPVPNGLLNATQLAEIAKVPLVKFEEKPDDKVVDIEEENPFPPDEEIPF